MDANKDERQVEPQAERGPREEPDEEDGEVVEDGLASRLPFCQNAMLTALHQTAKPGLYSCRPGRP
jgi:hypothetical protein